MNTKNKPNQAWCMHCREPLAYKKKEKDSPNAHDVCARTWDAYELANKIFNEMKLMC